MEQRIFKMFVFRLPRKLSLGSDSIILKEIIKTTEHSCKIQYQAFYGIALYTDMCKLITDLSRKKFDAFLNTTVRSFYKYIPIYSEAPLKGG